MASNTEVHEEPSELPHNYKTWILKVSIRCACEGCKRKVKKILTNIKGVHSVDVEAKQQKVIILGDVEADTLIRKLIKSGKNAELWPENPDQKVNKLAKVKKTEDPKEKQIQNVEPQTNKEAGHGSKNVEKEIIPPAKVEKPHDSAKTNDPQSAGDEETPAKSGGETKVGEVAAKASGEGEVVKEPKTEGKLPETGSAANQSPAPANEKMAGETESTGEKSGGGNGNGGKKKKKKAQIGNSTVAGPPLVPPPASTRSVNHNGGLPASIPANQSAPRHQGYQHIQPPHHYTPPPPVYGVSYNMAHPSSSHTASYYATQPPNSYAYSYPGSGGEPPYSYPYPHSGSMELQPLDFDRYPRQPLDSFEMFSDENPNGCSIS